MRAVIVSGGSVEDEFLNGFLKTEGYDFLVAADRGMEFCKRNGVCPDFIIGDFDSGNKKTLDFFEKAQIPIVYLRPEKDDSDTQSACKLAMEKGADRITLLGATGTRLDHVLANLQLLAWGEEQGVAMELRDVHNCITVHKKSFSVRKAEQFGQYVSFFSLGDLVENLTLEGFKYPLCCHMLKNTDSGLSVSNELVEECARVTFTKGTLLMIQSRD